MRESYLKIKNKSILQSQERLWRHWGYPITLVFLFEHVRKHTSWVRDNTPWRHGRSYIGWDTVYTVLKPYLLWPSWFLFPRCLHLTVLWPTPEKASVQLPSVWVFWHLYLQKISVKKHINSNFRGKCQAYGIGDLFNYPKMCIICSNEFHYTVFVEVCAVT